MRAVRRHSPRSALPMALDFEGRGLGFPGLSGQHGDGMGPRRSGARQTVDEIDHHATGDIVEAQIAPHALVNLHPSLIYTTCGVSFLGEAFGLAIDIQRPCDCAVVGRQLVLRKRRLSRTIRVQASSGT